MFVLHSGHMTIGESDISFIWLSNQSVECKHCANCKLRLVRDYADKRAGHCSELMRNYLRTGSDIVNFAPPPIPSLSAAIVPL